MERMAIEEKKVNEKVALLNECILLKKKRTEQRAMFKIK